MPETYKEFIERKNNQFESQRRNRQCAVKMKDIGRQGYHYFLREAWTFFPQGNLDKKVFIFERLRWHHFQPTQDGGLPAYEPSDRTGDIEYRIGYYIVGQINNALNQWRWGQYCPMIPHQDLMQLIGQAIRKKVIIDEDSNSLKMQS